MKIGFIGMGNMAQALCEGFIASGQVDAGSIFAYAPHRDRLLEKAKRLGFTPKDSLRELAESAEMLFVACKPYQIRDALTEIGPALSGKALVSIAAGWTLAEYDLLLAELSAQAVSDAAEQADADEEEDETEPLIDTVRVQAVMPNTPAMVGEGVFLLEEEHTLTQEEHDFLLSLLTPLGLVHELPARLFSAGSAITGCSPAFVDLFIEAYADAAVKYGIPRADAYRLVSQAVLGAAKLQLTTGMHPGALKDQVCSPAGTTIRGVQALEDCGLRSACMASIDAILDR